MITDGMAESELIRPAGDPGITQLLVQYGGGDQNALEKLLPLVYNELRRLAQSYMRTGNPAHTLQPTALVDECYFRLIDQNAVQWKSRAQFFGIAAQLMRRILVEHVRGIKAAKRSGTQARHTFDDALGASKDESGPDILAIDAALKKLAELDPRQVQVVELRYFGGLSVEETAEVMGVSPAAVKRDWFLAKAWLYRELTEEPSSGE